MKPAWNVPWFVKPVELCYIVRSEMASPKQRRYTPEIKAKCFKLYCEEFTLPTIAQRYEVSLGTLTQWSSLEKWKQKRTELKEAAHQQAVTEAGKLAPPSSSVIEAMADLTLSEAQELYETDSQAVALRIGRIIKGLPDAILIAGADKVEKLDKIARKGLKLETDKPKTIINIGLLSGGRVRSALSAPSDSATPAEQALSLVEVAGSQPVTLDAEEV